VEEKQIEKMDAETKLKMKFVFDVIDYIGDNFPVVVPDSRIAIQFDAALNLEGHPALIIQMAQGFPFIIGDLKTGKLEKTEAKGIYSSITLDSREAILELKQAKKFYDKMEDLLFQHHKKVREKVTEVNEVLKLKIEK